MFFVNVNRRSAWKYTGSTTGGISVGILATQGGVLHFTNPAGQPTSFRFGTLGAGLSIGTDLLKAVFIPSGAHSFSPLSFIDRGRLYIVGSRVAGDLTAHDIRGYCGLVTVGGGFLAGVSGSVMLLGMDTRLFALCAAAAASPLIVPGGISSQLGTFYPQLLASAKAMLLMGSAGATGAVGGGVTGLSGYLT